MQFEALSGLKGKPGTGLTIRGGLVSLTGAAVLKDGILMENPSRVWAVIQFIGDIPLRITLGNGTNSYIELVNEGSILLNKNLPHWGEVSYAGTPTPTGVIEWTEASLDTQE